MLTDKRLADIRETLSKASPAPWQFAHDFDEVPTAEPMLLEMGITTEPTAPKNIQLQSNGKHHFWIELTDTQIAGDVIFDLDFIQDAREFVPELLAEIERLRGLLGRDLQ